MRQSLRKRNGQNQKGQALTEYMILLVMLVSILIGTSFALRGTLIRFWEEIANRTIGLSPLKAPAIPKKIGG